MQGQRMGRTGGDFTKKHVMVGEGKRNANPNEHGHRYRWTCIRPRGSLRGLEGGNVVETATGTRRSPTDSIRSDPGQAARSFDGTAHDSKCLDSGSWICFWCRRQPLLSYERNNAWPILLKAISVRHFPARICICICIPNRSSSSKEHQLCRRRSRAGSQASFSDYYGEGHQRKRWTVAVS